jgi:hypothetical protein
LYPQIFKYSPNLKKMQLNDSNKKELVKLEVSPVLTSPSPTPTSFVNPSAMPVGKLIEPETE